MFRFERENEDKLENYLKAEFSSQLASIWFNFRLKIIGLIVLLFISSIAVFIHKWDLTNAGLYLFTIALLQSHYMFGFINSTSNTFGYKINTLLLKSYNTLLLVDIKIITFAQNCFP